MIHEKWNLEIRGGKAALETYFLDTLQGNLNRKRPVVIICPGGGYEFVSDRESEPIAVQMNARGFHACVLKYSVKPASFPQALLELAKAVRLVRENAQRCNADPEKIIICGFSAGGHLACSMGTFWQEPWIAEELGGEKELYRPDGLLLCYPVITSGALAHEGSMQNITGGDEKLRAKMSLENQVTKDMPPVFLWHTYEDNTVPVENSLMLAQSLCREKIPVELHIYPHGPHGLSLANEETGMPDGTGGIEPHCQGWVELAAQWVREL